MKSSRILSQSFVWIGSATHSTSDAFRQRQRERIRIAQNPRGRMPTSIADGSSAPRPDSETPGSSSLPTVADGNSDSRERPAPIRRMQNNDKGPDKLCNEPNRAIGLPEAGPASPFARKEGK